MKVMKKMWIVLGLFPALAGAIVDGSQWIYLGVTPAGSGNGYAGVTSDERSSYLFLNPAAPAYVQRLNLSLQVGISPWQSLVNGSFSMPIPTGVLSVGGKLLNGPESLGGVNGFFVGFSKAIDRYLSFGFDGYMMVHGAGSNQMDIAVGGDIGAIVRLRKSFAPFDKGIGFKDNVVGITLKGLGKPAQVLADTPVPAIGIRGGISGTWMDYGWLKAQTGTELNLDVWPFQVYGIGYTTFSIVDHLYLRGGLVLGNNGLGWFGNGVNFYTLGASFAYKINEVPFEVFYSYNPVTLNNTSSAMHMAGVQVAFGYIDEKPPVVDFKVASSDLVDGVYYFSPNYDGNKDVVELAVNIKDESLVQKWEVKIYNENNEVVRSFRSEEERDIGLDFVRFWKKLWAKKAAVPVPEKIVWDGTSDKGTLVPEGKYFVVMTARDEINNQGTSSTNALVLDVTAPSGSIALYDRIFSPDGDGNKDVLKLDQQVSSSDRWRAELRNASGDVVLSWTWQTNIPSSLTWDGTDAKGQLLSDGVYDYLLYGEDLAGNKTILSAKGIVLTTQKQSLFVNLDKQSFSALKGQTVSFQPMVSERQGIEKWSAEIGNDLGEVVYRWEGKADLPTNFTWDGKDEQKKVVKDGPYTFKMKVVYESGHMPEAESRVILDNTPPAFTFEFDPPLFSPDNDGENDTLYIHLLTEDPQNVKQWEMVILDPDKKPFKIFKGEGNPAPTIRWDGRSDNGELVESAQDYTVRLTVEDTVGNTLTTNAGVIPVDILVEQTELGLRIRINSIEFEFGKANLRSAKMPILDRLAQILKKYSAYEIEVHGHTDNIGSEQRNLELSLQRAQAVKDYLVKKGIPARRMTTKGFGFQYPVADNATEEGRRKNRRVEFILIKK
ncbi:OmpA family protein [Thermospira aquatica]|uniref:OmpA family protein n=1 Tax=Thermospira aquatica TaxID=2828656 RepID=A0AAX3BB55_9SPIR|nr:OmpA family protein [Thermospira aquatica]URA09490.1 OmpA family protein [Thermospira aquatica]